ncbi:MAG: hypothetical protein J6D23_04335 [Clostridia bacterium]|nr:hypothetical protein [Clostridia bacterium]
MKMFKKEDKTLPTLITDLSGKILYIDETAKKEMFPANIGDSILKFLSPDLIRKASILGRMNITSPENCKYERAIVKVVGQGVTKTLEVSFFHANADNIEKDIKLFSSYDEIVARESVEPVELNDLVTEIVDYIKKDLRFSYKNFEIIITESESRLYADFDKLCAIVIGTITVYNEIDYRADITISIIKEDNDYILSVSLHKIMFEAINGPHELSMLNPHVATRIEYLNSLCQESKIEYKLSSKPDGIYAEFVITNSVNDTGKFAQKSTIVSKDAFISYIMSLFIYEDINDTTEEEQE